MEAQDILNYLVTPAAQISFIMAVAEIAKENGLPKKFVPIFDVVLGAGLGIAIFSVMLDLTIVEGAILGVFSGLSACGLFSGAKNVMEKVEDERKN